MLAPIALFVYKRPDHARNALQSLATNPEFEASPLFIYSDGARGPEDEEAVKQTRAVVRANATSLTTIIEQPSNVGLANSIISGVTQLCSQYGRVIVLEDDLFVSSRFLAYMNAALTRYADDDVVMQIAGYMFAVDLKVSEDSFFAPFTTSWGWATWQRAWQHFDPDMRGLAALEQDRFMRQRFNLDGAYDYYGLLQRQQRRQVDSWAVRWYLSVFLRHGLTLYPKRTLVENRGMTGGGTHCTNDPFGAVLDADFGVRSFPDTLAVAPCWRDVALHIRRRNTGLPALVARISNFLGFNHN